MAALLDCFNAYRTEKKCLPLPPTRQDRKEETTKQWDRHSVYQTLVRGAIFIAFLWHLLKIMQYFTYHENCKSEFNPSFRGMQPHGPTYRHLTLL